MRFINNLGVLFLISIFYVTTAAAQILPIPVFRGKSASFGLNGNYALGELNSGYRIGAGAYIKAEIPITTFNFTVSAGYTDFLANQTVKNVFTSDGNHYKSYSYVPINIGAKYYITTNFYGALETGGVIGLNNGSKPAFSYAPGVGLAFPIGSKKAIDMGVSYEKWERKDTQGEVNINQFMCFKLAYKFGIE